MCQLGTERRERREDRDSLASGIEWFSRTEATAAREGQAWRELCAYTPFSELGLSSHLCLPPTLVFPGASPTPSPFRLAPQASFACLINPLHSLPPTKPSYLLPPPLPHLCLLELLEVSNWRF